MSTISSQEIISIIKGEIEDYDAHAGQVNETGSVIWVGDGIAIVYGIDHAMYGEIVIFENGVQGMVQDLSTNDRPLTEWDLKKKRITCRMNRKHMELHNENP